MRKFFLFKKYRCQKTSHSRNELCVSFSLSKTRQARGGARDRAGWGAHRRSTKPAGYRSASAHRLGSWFTGWQVCGHGWGAHQGSTKLPTSTNAVPWVWWLVCQPSNPWNGWGAHRRSTKPAGYRSASAHRLGSWFTGWQVCGHGWGHGKPVALGRF